LRYFRNRANNKKNQQSKCGENNIFWQLLTNITESGTINATEKQAKVDAVNVVFGYFFKLIWLIIFLAVSFGVYQEARFGHDFWVTDVFRGLFGGVLLIYPFMEYLWVLMKWLITMECISLIRLF
jgi:hypothetical protein